MKKIENVSMNMYHFLYKKITSQDFKQHVNMVISVSIELYRVLVSSLLILFIPQKCDQHICSLSENLYEPELHYRIGIIMNWITMAIFLLMYFTEIRREEKLIKILEVNNTISTDNDSVGRRLNIFPQYKREQLFLVDRQYQYASYIVSVVFVVNTIYSWKVIYVYSLGNQTLINFVTNILFMISKLTNVFGIIHTDKNIFFSAYLNTKVQFNDIDPREIIKIRNTTIEENDMYYEIELIEDGGFYLQPLEI